MLAAFEVTEGVNDMTPSRATATIERFQETVRDAETTTISLEVDFCREVLDAIVALLMHAQTWRVTDGPGVIAPPECAPEGPLSGSKAPESGAHSLPGSGAALICIRCKSFYMSYEGPLSDVTPGDGFAAGCYVLPWGIDEDTENMDKKFREYIKNAEHCPHYVDYRIE